MVLLIIDICSIHGRQVLVPTTNEGSIIVSDDLPQPMAVICRQMQQQEQQQMRLGVAQQQSAFSLPRPRDYDQRAHGTTNPVVNLDPRFVFYFIFI